MDCTENKSTKFCGAQNETIYIEFKNRNGRESSTSGTKFKLKITAKKEYDCK